MATIKFFTVGKSETSTIYVRFFHGKKYDFKRATHLRVRNKHWDCDKQRVRNVADAANKDEINQYLKGLDKHLDKQFLKDYSNGVIISAEWFESQINAYFQQKDDNDLNLLSNYCEYFISNLPTKKNSSKGTITLGVSERTVEKYQNVVNKLNAFQAIKKKKLQLTDVDLKFERDFIKFLKEGYKTYDKNVVQGLSDNTIGRTITFVKTICNDARDNGIKVNPQLSKIKGFKTKTKFVTLNEGEIRDIFGHDFTNSPHLDNARDWLIVGLHSGQRVSDFMMFTSDTINGGFLEFTQIKTGVETVVPLHPYVKAVIKKHGGEFPRKISEQKFNDYIKKVCDKVGITEMVEGALMNPETKRKEQGVYPKYKLVSSHICRRSFATNHYGKLATPDLMCITGHTSETMFLNYIGKTPKDSAKKLSEYWEGLEYVNKTNQSPLKVLKSQA